MFDFIDCNNGLPESLALRFFYQTAVTISQLHSLGIAHRDVKPENLLLDSRFNVKLTDFGWATHLSNDESLWTPSGTFAYMSPEMVVGVQHSSKTDIWSLGVLLVELLNGWLTRVASFRGGKRPGNGQGNGSQNAQGSKAYSARHSRAH